jgi:ribosome-binding protein aMBF1 (putative translation factor)
MSNSDTYDRDYRRHMLRSTFQSLFWHVFSARKKESGLTGTGLADRLGHTKSYVSRLFTDAPNWQIDKLSDLSEALDVDLVVEARDRKTGRMFAPHGDEHFSGTVSKASIDTQVIRQVIGATTRGGAKVVSA